jgi:hypothetical protein
MKKKLPQSTLVEKSYTSYSKPNGMCKNDSVFVGQPPGQDALGGR